MVILWESGEIQNIFRNINLYFPNPQSIGISLPNFFQRSTSNGISHVREHKTDTGTFSQKIKNWGHIFWGDKQFGAKTDLGAKKLWNFFWEFFFICV